MVKVIGSEKYSDGDNFQIPHEISLLFNPNLDEKVSELDMQDYIGFN